MILTRLKDLTFSPPMFSTTVIEFVRQTRGDAMNKAERVFKLKLFEDSASTRSIELNCMASVGELWQGKGRVPVAGVMTYRGRVDAVITFFVDQFLSDEIFQPGDSLVLAPENGEASILLARRKGSA
jgi:hypothetical protein